jgi:predicted metal-binding membrane protein
MTVAMMTPLVIPNVRWLAGASLRRRRARAVVLFLGGYFIVWLPVAFALAVGVSVLAALVGPQAALVVAFAAAGAWQFSGAKHAALRRCTATAPIPPRGPRADRGCVRYGIGVAAGCVTSCWAVMAAGMATGHGVAAMAVLGAALVGERLPRVYQPRDGAALLAVLGGVLLAGS